MSVQIFTVQEFERALPVNKNTGEQMWQSSGIVAGEYSYTIPVSNECSIEIRSSVRANGYSASTGKDSIRAWLVSSDGEPAGSKVQSYVTRVRGWEDRLTDMLRKLYKIGRAVKTCQTCGTLIKVFKVKKDGPNKGKLFTKCMCANSFKYIEV